MTALAAGFPVFAWAQDGNGGLQDIVVTARRVAENLQDVPISVGAIDQAALQARGISSLTEIKGAIANVTISKTAVAGGNYVFIRGIAGASIPNVAVDSTIGLYLDGVFLGRVNSSGGDIADLERIEVLRGPQGTLSGRNAAGGAVNFITASPTGEFGVIADGTIGNFGRYRGRLTVNTPEVAGFSARVTYVHDQNHGTIRNRAGGTTYDYGSYGRFTAANRVDALNSDTVMAKLRYTGIDNLNVEYKFDYSDQQEVFPGISTVGFPTSTIGQRAANLVLAQPPGAVPLRWDRPNYVNLDMLSPARIRAYGHMLTAAWDVSDAVTAKSITAYRNLKTLQQSDVDGLALTTAQCIGCAILRLDQNQVSQEFQLIGSASRLKYIAGLYYFREKGFADNPFSFFRSLVPGPDGVIPVGVREYATAGSRENARNTSYAAYAHLDYSIFDNLELALGARYTIDERESVDTRPSLPTVLRGDVRFKRFNYDVALTYSVTSDIHVYGRYATGYKSGGIIKSAAFAPEDHKAFEVGVKSELFDRRIRFNAAYFRTRVRDQQRSLTGANGLIIVNSSSSTIQGVEAELTVAPARGLTFGANYGYNRIISPDFQDVPQTPEHNFSFNAQYETPRLENDIFLTFRLDGDYRSKYYGAGFLLKPQRTANPAFPLPPQIWAGYASQQAYLDDMIASNLGGGYWMVNARISINDIPVAGTKARLTGYVRNLTDTEGRNYFVNNSLFQTSYERPMNYGLELGITF